MTTLVERDERTVAVENAGYRWSYLALSFGILLVVMMRSFRRQEQSWDLLGLVVLGGLVNAVYQARHQTIGGRWLRTTGFVLVAAGAVAALILLAS